MEGNRNNCGSMIGKFVGSALAAKFVGQNCMIATIGALMNTRGLMELIVLNIGLELKCAKRSIYNDGNYGIGNNVHDRTSFEFNWLYFWNKKTCGGG
jgi:Kef-type K+ transport system membrane component KefB